MTRCTTIGVLTTSTPKLCHCASSCCSIITSLPSTPGVQRGLVGEIIKRFEQKGYYLVGLKLLNVERSLAEEHYVDLASKPFYQGLVDYIISAPVVAMAWRGKNVRKGIGRDVVGKACRESCENTCVPTQKQPSHDAHDAQHHDLLSTFALLHTSPSPLPQHPQVVATGRTIIGATNPLASAPGTIRGDFCIDVGRNVIHGSDSVESAQRELALWFPEGLATNPFTVKGWVYE